MRQSGKRKFVFATAFLARPFWSKAQDEQPRIPQDIYTFWDGPQPGVMQACLDTWRELAPGWKIHVIDRSNMYEYAPDLPPAWESLESLNKVQHLSELVRLEVLAMRAGVWLDASVALVAPLSSWVPTTSKDNALIGFDLDFVLLEQKEIDLSVADWASHFHSNGSLKLAPATNSSRNARFFESWGFAAAPGCPILQLWLEEFRAAVTTKGGVEAYCTALKNEPDAETFLSPSLQKLLPYLVAHAALARVRHRNPSLAVKTYPAESEALAYLDYAPSWALVRLSKPTNYILDGTGGAVLALARGDSEGLPPPATGKVIKLRSLDRPAFHALLVHGGYAMDSPLAQVFNLPPLPRIWPVRVMRYVAAFQAKFGNTNDPFLLALFRVIEGISFVMLTAARHPLWCLLLLVLAVRLGTSVQTTTIPRDMACASDEVRCAFQAKFGDTNDPFLLALFRMIGGIGFVMFHAACHPSLCLRLSIELAILPGRVRRRCTSNRHVLPNCM
jgi:hypothetical protein